MEQEEKLIPVERSEQVKYMAPQDKQDKQARQEGPRQEGGKKKRKNQSWQNCSQSSTAQPSNQQKKRKKDQWKSRKKNPQQDSRTKDSRQKPFKKLAVIAAALAGALLCVLAGAHLRDYMASASEYPAPAAQVAEDGSKEHEAEKKMAVSPTEIEKKAAAAAQVETPAPVKETAQPATAVAATGEQPVENAPDDAANVRQGLAKVEEIQACLGDFADWYHENRRNCTSEQVASEADRAYNRFSNLREEALNVDIGEWEKKQAIAEIVAVQLAWANSLHSGAVKGDIDFVDMGCNYYAPDAYNRIHNLANSL